MRAKDVVKFSRFYVPRFIGYVAEREGEFLGAVCIVWGKNDRAFLCLELSDEIRRRPILMNRYGKMMIKAAHQAGTELYTIESSAEPSAPRWLQRLGFRPTDELQGLERIWRWQA
jgi:hypothetical protein